MNALISLHQPILACTICWGSDGNSMDGANAAVAFLLVVLIGVLGAFLTFIFYLARRSRLAAEEEAQSLESTAAH